MSTAAPVKTASAGKNEAFVEQQLARARQRVRLLDLTTAFLVFAILTFLYGLGMILLDRWLELPSLTRQLGFALYLCVALVYLGVRVVWPLCRRVNPYFAAKQVEQTLPNAKNSVVNWLDLRTQPLPSAIRGAVTNRAAKDLARADLDDAISARRTFWLGGAVCALAFVLFTLFVIDGKKFLSLFGRTFAPFVENTIATRTQLRIVQPAGGDATVPLGRPVSFVVEVKGKIPSANKPDAVKLLYRHLQHGQYEEVPMERGDSAREWVALVPAFQVHNGFWYKVTGGDFETSEHCIQVRATPLLADFDVKYRYRPYLRWPERAARDPNLEALRGTEVTLVARANRAVKEGHLEFTPEVAARGTAPRKPIPAELVPGETQAMRFRFIIDQDGAYRIWFVTDEGERNSDPLAYQVKSLRDAAPIVELKAASPPAKAGEGGAIFLPVNGVLPLEGKAHDDFGVTGMTLRLQLNKEPLHAKPYRDGKKEQFRLADRSYPQNLEYKDFVEIDKLRASGQPLKAGMVLDCWLEATDECDYPPPGPNVGRSDVLKITLTDPIDDKKKDEQRNQAQQQQKEHQKKQDQDLKEQIKQQEGANAEQKPQPKPETKEEKDLNKKAEEIQKALEQKEKEKKKDENKGEPKPDKKPESKGEAKDEGKKDPNKQENNGEGKPEPKNDAGKKEAGKQKGEGKPDPSDKAKKNEGEGKGPGQQANAEPKPPEDKGEQGDNKGESKPEPKNDAGKKEAGKEKGEGKTDPNDQQKKNEGEGKGPGMQGPGLKSQPQDKGEGKREPQQQTGTAEAKGAGKDDQNAGQGEGKDDKGQAKGEQPSQPQGQAKGAGQQATSEPAKGKSGGKDGGKGGNGPGQEKPSRDKGGPDNEFAKGSPKGEGKDPGTGEAGDGAGDSKTKQAIKDLAKQLQSGDARQRQEAKEKLEQMSRDGQKADRDAASQALQQAEKNPGQGAKTETARQIDSLADQLAKAERQRQEAESKLKEQAQDAEKPADREAAERALKNPEQGPDKKAGPEIQKLAEQLKNACKDCKNAGDKLSELSKNAPNQEERDAAAEALQGKIPGLGENGGNPGVGTNRQGETTGDPASNPDDGDPANPNFHKKAGDLQLDEFKKKVTKDMLKDLNLTEKEWQQFLKDYAEMLKRRQDGATPDDDNLVRPGGGLLRNQAAQRVQAGKPKTDTVPGAGPAGAPPEFRDAFKEFTEKLSTLKRADK